MSKRFRVCDLNQPLLLPPSLQDWLPEGHLARFVADLSEELDLCSIYATYARRDGRGQAAYHPLLMVRLLIYAYCLGVMSSRRIERATYEDVAFRYLAADQHPDHDTVASFRQAHLASLAGLFAQALGLCQKAGLVKLGHVAIDGTKLKANASKHKAMSYERMGEAEKKLQEQVEQLLAEAARVDAEEDQKYGKGNRGDELPVELARRESRLAKIRAAKAELEREAKEQAEQEKTAVDAKLEERRRREQERGKRLGGRPPQAPDPEQALPDGKAQRNFTDPDSRIMKDGASQSFVQGYNAQAAVDAERQIIVAASLTQQANDKQQLVPMLERVQQTTGRWPETATADAGYFSRANVTDAKLKAVELLVPPDRQKHGGEVAEAPAPAEAAVIEQMRQKLQTPEGNAVYAMRKATVEPVFGQIKGARGIRGFLLRGLSKVDAEWKLICATHNILKLFRSGWNPKLEKRETRKSLCWNANFGCLAVLPRKC
jgi:transposase